MRTDSFFDQQRAREVNVAPLRTGTSTREARTSARRPAFDGLTIGLHGATVLFVLAQFPSAWLHTPAGIRQNHFTPLLRQIHRSLGVTLWVLILLPPAWRL